eukprot:CAMPEP_0176374792 /NCGR_PEP_ID=MMETSP0126-20121128/27026_1 /TAXON_ID=141414 ORGANISM="Strombidinopsis acuminatum, Strain SPMC142" /NCGR_SAMPLE_ID=MMETSP0126 /ASSEMBLY_ACC=CAM_ASM_000229 /LENGTH=32 /DNA_ID= /DNA_START= /DNA_END= /DNA_ORIENTATION=
MTLGHNDMSDWTKDEYMGGIQFIEPEDTTETN